MVHIDVDIVEYVIILKRNLTIEEINLVRKNVNFIFNISCGADLVVDQIDVNHDILNQYTVLDSSAQYPTYESSLLRNYNNRHKTEGFIERRIPDPKSDEMWNDFMSGKIEYCTSNNFKFESVSIEQVEKDFNEKLQEYLSKTQFNFDRFGKEKLDLLLNHELIRTNLKGHYYRTRRTTY